MNTYQNAAVEIQDETRARTTPGGTLSVRHVYRIHLYFDTFTEDGYKLCNELRHNQTYRSLDEVELMADKLLAAINCRANFTLNPQRWTAIIDNTDRAELEAEDQLELALEQFNEDGEDVDDGDLYNFSAEYLQEMADKRIATLTRPLFE